jgi:hypothetical protein
MVKKPTYRKRFQMSKKAEMFRRLTLGLTPDRAAALSGISSRKVKNKYTAEWHHSQALPDPPEPAAPPTPILDRDISTLTEAEKVEYDKAAIAAGWRPGPEILLPMFDCARQKQPNLSWADWRLTLRNPEVVPTTQPLPVKWNCKTQAYEPIPEVA